MNSIKKYEEQYKHTRFEVFTAVRIQVEVFWVVMLCSIVVGYQCFRGLNRYPTTASQPRP
jgi:hypothetical protein